MMKKRIWIFLISVFSFIANVQVAQSAENYVLDPDHSYVTWHVNHFGFSNVAGTISAEGTLNLDEAQPANSSVNVTINLANIRTTSDKFTETLKSRKFFNISAFPTASFVSNNITMTGENTAKVSGTLTIHGVSKPVVLNTRINKIGMHTFYGFKAAGFSATLVIRRSEFGLGSFAPGVSDEVKIDIEVEAKKAS